MYICDKNNCFNCVDKFQQKYCKTHGGGMRCKFEGCETSAERPSDYCKKHGGGKRCQFEGCETSAECPTDYCKKHGGGKRCKFEGCKIAAQNPTDFCIKHGGGILCNFDGCKKASQGNGFCKAHGGGIRCQSEACSIYEIPNFGRYKHNGQYLCHNCFYQLYPDAASKKLFIRQEHLVLAEIQRLIEDDLNAISCIWDCPIKCSLKVPDLMYELDDIYVSFEVDENGHNQPIERILEFRNILDKPFIMYRINPNLAEKPLLKKNRLSNGESVWKATEHFEPLMNEFKNIVLEEIDNITNRDNNNDLPCYTEVGFLFNKYPNDRGNIIENNYGYIVYS